MFLPNPEGGSPSTISTDSTISTIPTISQLQIKMKNLREGDIHNIHRFQMETNSNLDRGTDPNVNPNTNPNVNHNSKSKSKS